MKLFKKPSWLKPEINEPIYYVHLLVIAVVVLGILQLVVNNFSHTGEQMFTIKNILLSIPLLLAGDMVAHTILKMN